jgi:hypothetical protein
MIEHPYRTIELPSGALALVPDYAKSRRIAAELEARDRAQARPRSWWRKLLGSRA